MLENQEIQAVPVIHTKNKYPSILDIGKLEAIACD